MQMWADSFNMLPQATNNVMCNLHGQMHYKHTHTHTHTHNADFWFLNAVVLQSFVCFSDVTCDP